MPDKIEKILQDYIATANSGKYNSWDEVNSKFPELKGYDASVLQDYVTTANSGKYKTIEDVNAKFPELFKKKSSNGASVVSKPELQSPSKEPKTVQPEGTEEWNTIAPESRENLRPDGTKKGKGFLGELPMQDGSGKKATELSIGIEIDGKETLIPTIVPTLTDEERQFLLKGGNVLDKKNPMANAIVDKAVAHAKERISTGKTPFAEEENPFKSNEKVPVDSPFSPDYKPKPVAIPIDDAFQYTNKELANKLEGMNERMRKSKLTSNDKQYGTLTSMLDPEPLSPLFTPSGIDKEGLKDRYKANGIYDLKDKFSPKAIQGSEEDVFNYLENRPNLARQLKIKDKLSEQEQFSIIYKSQENKIQSLEQDMEILRKRSGEVIGTYEKTAKELNKAAENVGVVRRDFTNAQAKLLSEKGYHQASATIKQISLDIEKLKDYAKSTESEIQNIKSNADRINIYLQPYNRLIVQDRFTGDEAQYREYLSLHEQLKGLNQKYNSIVENPEYKKYAALADSYNVAVETANSILAKYPNINEKYNSYKQSFDKYNTILAQAEQLKANPDVQQYYKTGSELQGIAKKLSDSELALPSLKEIKFNNDLWQKRFTSMPVLSPALSGIVSFGNAVTDLGANLTSGFVNAVGGLTEATIEGRDKYTPRQYDKLALFFEDVFAAPFIRPEKSLVDQQGNFTPSFSGAANDVASQIPLFVFLAMTSGTGAVLGQEAKGIAGKLISKQALNLTVQGALASYSGYYKLAQEKGLEGTEAHTYAAQMSFFEGASELISPNRKILFKEFSPKLLDDYVQVLAKKQGVGAAIKEGLKTYSEDFLKENFEEWANMGAQMMVDFSHGLKAEPPTVGQILQTAISMAPLIGGSGYSGYKNARQEQQIAVYKMANDPENAKLQLDAAFERGDITQEDHDAIINDMAKLVVKLGGVPSELSDIKKIMISNNLMAIEDAQTTIAGENIDPSIKASYEAQIKEWQNNIKKIMVAPIGELEKEFATKYGYTEPEIPKVEPIEPKIEPVEAPKIEPKIEPVEPKVEPLAEEVIPIGTKLSDAIETPPEMSIKGEKGVIKVDEGGKVEFVTETTSHELGNIEEIKNKSLSELGVEEIKPLDIEVAEDYSITIDGNKYVNNFSDPMAAVNHDKSGNVISINLETEDGKKRTIRGDRAEQVAYNYTLLNFENNATEEQIRAATEEAGTIEPVEGKVEKVEPKTEEGVAPETPKPVEPKSEVKAGEPQVKPPATEGSGVGGGVEQSTAPEAKDKVVGSETPDALKNVEDEKERTVTPVSKGNKNTLEIEGYGSILTSGFINRLVEAGRLPNEALKTRHIQLTKEYATKLLNENSDLFTQEPPKPKPTLRQNTAKKYNKIPVESVRTEIMKYFASGYFLDAEETQRRTGLPAKDLIGFIKKGAYSYHDLAESIGGELGRDVNGKEFDDLVTDIISMGKGQIYNELNALIDRQNGVDDRISPEDELADEEKNVIQGDLDGELSLEEQESLDNVIAKYTENGITNWAQIEKDIDGFVPEIIELTTKAHDRLKQITEENLREGKKPKEGKANENDIAKPKVKEPTKAEKPTIATEAIDLENIAFEPKTPYQTGLELGGEGKSDARKEYEAKISEAKNNIREAQQRLDTEREKLVRRGASKEKIAEALAIFEKGVVEYTKIYQDLISAKKAKNVADFEKKQNTLFEPGKEYNSDAQQNPGKFDKTEGYAASSETFIGTEIINLGVNFMGNEMTGPAKIKSPADIAYIFRHLENEKSENAFAVFEKGGKYQVLYIGTGGTSATVVDAKKIVAAAKDYGAERVTFIHNHPSGNLSASPQDKILFRNVKELLEELDIALMDGIIIDIDKGLFATFDDQISWGAIDRPTSVEKERAIEIHHFGKNKYYQPESERTQVVSSHSVGVYLSKQKRGTTPKIQAIILNRANIVTKSLMYDETIDMEQLKKELIYEVAKYGESLILASNNKLTTEFIADLKRVLNKQNTNILDVVDIKQDESILQSMKSWADEGKLGEPEVPYGSEGIRLRSILNNIGLSERGWSSSDNSQLGERINKELKRVGLDYKYKAAWYNYTKSWHIVNKVTGNHVNPVSVKEPPVEYGKPIPPEALAKASEVLKKLFDKGTKNFDDVINYLSTHLGEEKLTTPTKYGPTFIDFLKTAYITAWAQSSDADELTSPQEVKNYERREKTTTGQRLGNGNGIGSRPAGTPATGGVSNDKRPSLRVIDQENLPKPGDHVNIGQYDIDENQRLAVNLAVEAFTSDKKGFMLADGTGVGKTRIELVAAEEWRKKSNKPVLIVTKNKQIIAGSFTADAKSLGINLDNFVMATYTGLDKIPKQEYGLVIFDEAHEIKNATSQKSIEAGNIKSDHIMFATATPMDRPTGSAYFISKMSNRPLEEVEAEMGFYTKVEVDKYGNEKKGVYPLKGFNWGKIFDNIIKIRKEAIKNGQMIRREYPFFGTITSDNVLLGESFNIGHQRIDDYWQERIDAARSPQAKKNLAGQRIGELSRHTESGKIDIAYKLLKKDLAEGRSVILIAEGVNDSEIKGLDGQVVKGLLSEVAKRLTAEGIDFAKIFGPGDKGGEVTRFQNGGVRVALATPQSGGTGVNLDDIVGDKPRTMLVTTANYAGDQVDQIFGRVSRRNTASPAKIQMLFSPESLSDERRRQIFETKAKVLRRIQAGEDPDLAMLYEQTEGGIGEDGQLAADAASNSRTIDEIVKATGEKADSFLFHDRVKKILEKLGVPVAEKLLSKRYLGLFKHREKKIRVQGLFDIFVASHEAAHWISREFGIGLRIRADKNGTKDLRKMLTDIYVEFYPRARRSHSLEKRVEEGIAVLLENYLYDPTGIHGKYGLLVDSFLKPTGEYYHPKFSELLGEMNKLIKDYSNLTPEQKIGTRIVSGDVVKDQEGLGIANKLITQIVSSAAPLTIIDEMAGAKYSDQSEVAYIRWLDRSKIVTNWVQGKTHAMSVDKRGNWFPIKASVEQYLRTFKTDEERTNFEEFLVARRAVGDVNYLHELENELAEVINKIIEREQDLDEVDRKGPTGAEKALIKQLAEQVERQRSIIANDKFDLQTVTDVVNKFEGKFTKATEIYDRINNALVDFAYTKNLLSAQQAQDYKSNKTYARFMRMVMDDLMTDLPQGTNSQAKVRVFMGRKGSDLAVVSPIYGQILAINEVISKGLQNDIWLRVADLSSTNPEIARLFEHMPTVRAVDDTGKVTYPQTNKPNHIMVWRDGVREFYLASPELIGVAESLTPQQFDTAATMLRYASGVFTRFTTTAFPIFPLINVPVDTVSALMNTKTGFRPGWDQLKALKHIGIYMADYIKHAETVTKWWNKIAKTKIKDLQEEDMKLFDKYLALGGHGHTQASFYNLMPEEAIVVAKGGTKIKKAIDILEIPLSIMELPTNISEWMTRFAEFSRAKKLGYNDDTAMYMASQVTVAFQQTGAMGGPVGRAWVKSMPYFSAAIQVLAKLLRSTKDQPERVGLVVAALLSIGLSLMMLLMEYGDDDDKDLLSNQEPADLARWLYFPNFLVGGKGFTRIRIPEQVGSINAMAMMAILSFYDPKRNIKYSFNDYVKAGTVSIPQQFNVTQPAQMFTSWLPQLVRPGAETLYGIKSYPEMMPIVPMGLSHKESQYQYTEYTSKVAKSAGQMMGVSPMKLDYFIKAQFGRTIPYFIPGFKNREVHNPLEIDYEDYKLRGRVFNNFHEMYRNVSAQNSSLKEKKAEGMKLDEYIKIKANFKALDALKDILTDVRRKDSIPLDAAKLIFKVVNDVTNSQNPYELTPDIVNLKRQVDIFLGK